MKRLGIVFLLLAVCSGLGLVFFDERVEKNSDSVQAGNVATLISLEKSNDANGSAVNLDIITPSNENQNLLETHIEQRDYVAEFNAGTLRDMAVDDLHPLYPYLRSLWDEQSDFIDDYNYTVEVTQLPELSEPFLFMLTKKLYDDSTKEEFAESATSMLLEDTDVMKQFGEISEQRVWDIRDLIGQLELEHGGLNLQNLVCRELRCSFVIVLEDESVNMAFSKKVKEMNATLQLMSHSSSATFFVADVFFED